VKIALISSFAHEYTTATYFEEVFNQKKLFFKRFRPKEQRKIPQEFDFYFFVDDGTEYVIYPNPRVKKVLYIIDTHMGINDDLSMIKFVDHVFCAQKNAVNFIECFNSNVSWLPLACSPDVHYGRGKSRKYDIAFIGWDGFGARAEVIGHVRNRYSNVYIGRAPKSEIGNIYSSSKIVLNASVNNDINMRFFEGTCSGAMLLTDEIRDNGLEDIHPQGDGKYYVKYGSIEDLDDKLKFYLKDEHREERLQIACKGREFALQNTYRHRWETIVEVTESTNINKPEYIMYSIYRFKLLFKKIMIKVKWQR